MRQHHTTPYAAIRYRSTLSLTSHTLFSFIYLRSSLWYRLTQITSSDRDTSIEVLIKIDTKKYMYNTQKQQIKRRKKR